MIGLAEIAGPIACIGLAVLLLARTRRNRIAGLCYAGVGSVLLAVSLAPTNAAELGVAVGGVIVLGPLLVWLFRREPWLVAFATLAFVPFRIGFLGHSLLVPLYAVALGAAGLLLWQLVEGDERTRELGIVSWPLALYLLWIGFSVGWSVDVHSAAIDLLAFYVPFTIIAVSIARLPWRASRVRILYGELVAMALVFAVVGFYQYETKTIFQNAKLHQSNIYEALFRVNSVFFDPSIYGRFLVVALIATAVLIVRSGPSLRVGLAALAFTAVAWLGLLISFSQSSFAALLVAVFALTAIVWRWKSLYRARGRPRRRGRDRRDPAAPDACAAPPHDLGPQSRHERAGDSDRGGDQDRRSAPVARRRARWLRARVLETHAQEAEEERVAQHPGDRRRGGGRARASSSSSGSSGRCCSPRTGGSSTAPTDGSRSRPGSALARDLRPLARVQRLLRGSDHVGADRPGRARLAATGAGARAGASGADGARA